LKPEKKDVVGETPAHAVHMSSGDIGPRNSIIPPGDEHPADYPDYPGSAGSLKAKLTWIAGRGLRVAVFETSLCYPAKFPHLFRCPYNTQFRGSSARLRVSD